MFLMKLQSLVPRQEISNAKEDYKSAKRVGQYKVSTKAIYRPDGGYVPFAAVKDYVLDKSSVHVTGCCAGGGPVERIILITDEGKFPFLFDSQKAVGKIVELMNVARIGHTNVLTKEH